MSLSFKAHCAGGISGDRMRHARIDFTDPLAFEQHMVGVHGKRKPRVGGPEDWTAGSSRTRCAPGWSRTPRPYPWTPPRPTLAPEIIDAMNYEELSVSFDEELDGTDVKAVIETAWEAVCSMPRCETCGEPIDYCQGHGELG